MQGTVYKNICDTAEEIWVRTPMSTVYEQDALTLPAPSGIYSKWLWVKASSKLLKSGQIDIPGERTSWQLVYFTCRSIKC